LKLDLHTHTTVSDGSFTPQEILAKAAELDLQYFAITDHDTIDALEQIEEIPAGVVFINGVEISAEFPKTLHILGYNFDSQNQKLRSILHELQEFRKKRNAKMLQKLAENGFHISLEELETEAKGELVGRPHFANLMFKKGYIGSYQEAFDLYLDKGKPFYMNKKRLAPKLAVELILQAGGIPVLAHPYQTKLNDEDLDKLIKELKDYGLMGIEVYYSQHSNEQIEKYLKFSEKFNLLATAGSDFHGINKPHIPLGMDVPQKHLEKFLEAIL
jgi:hypothetical protein